MSCVRQVRLCRGWSQEKLAREAGLSYQTVIRTEAGKHMSELTMYRLARALDVDVDELRDVLVPA